jgi:hypothetical protein
MNFGEDEIFFSGVFKKKPTECPFEIFHLAQSLTAITNGKLEVEA